MIEVEETDFKSLDLFPLRQRWADARWNKLPDD
jgi:hypothetical protein